MTWKSEEKRVRMTMDELKGDKRLAKVAYSLWTVFFCPQKQEKERCRVGVGGCWKEKESERKEQKKERKRSNGKIKPRPQG